MTPPQGRQQLRRRRQGGRRRLAAENFRDGELNIPESGNSVPDLLDEAALFGFLCAPQRGLSLIRPGQPWIGPDANASSKPTLDAPSKPAAVITP
ncbi:MAG TPA: hypothetical protein P5186_21440 [Candidatus Paceibacterota bacterium]|nr:hypothetical protein [Candidatus Paceibacterota bacterium]